MRRNRGRAGARARRKYARMRREWLRQNRRVWLVAALVGVAVWVAFWWMIDRMPGDQSWLTSAFAGALVASFLTLRQSPPVGIASWEAGAIGEQQTARKLRRLERDGWVVLHDLAAGSANFDHVVIGPNGVFCLNSKWSSYRLEEGPDGQLIARHRYDEELTGNIRGALRRARAEAAALSDRIAERCGTRLWVTPVIVWWGDVANGGRLVDGVGVVHGAHLADRLRSYPGRPVRDFDEVVARLRPGRRVKRRFG